MLLTDAQGRGKNFLKGDSLSGMVLVSKAGERKGGKIFPYFDSKKGRLQVPDEGGCEFSKEGRIPFITSWGETFQPKAIDLAWEGGGRKRVVTKYDKAKGRVALNFATRKRGYERGVGRGGKKKEAHPFVI